MTLVAYLGLALIFIGGIGFLIAAFKESIIWGIVCILISPAWILFLILHWQAAKNPFLLQMLGLSMVFIAVYLGADVSMFRR